jgi:hypothetical protein
MTELSSFTSSTCKPEKNAAGNFCIRNNLNFIGLLTRLKKAVDEEFVVAVASINKLFFI